MAGFSAWFGVLAFLLGLVGWFSSETERKTSELLTGKLREMKWFTSQVRPDAGCIVHEADRHSHRLLQVP